MSNVETQLTNIINNPAHKRLDNNYSRNTFINEIAGTLMLADSGMVSDNTISYIRNVVFTSIPNNHNILTSYDSLSLAILVDFFLTEEDIFELMLSRPKLISKIVCDNTDCFSSDVVKSAAFLYS